MKMRGARALRAIGLSVWCGAISLGAARGVAHPLHTTLVQMTYDAKGRVLEGSIRVFAGDFASAVAKHAGAKAPIDDHVTDAAAFAYVSSTFRLSDASGRAVPLAWCGSRRANDLLWLCVRAANAGPPNTIKLGDQMLCELFDDQINIVQSVAGEKHSSMLFTKGDAAKSVM
ncbi:MAG: hypothetical protein H0U66_01700 [Gemmatimonadaceae bacterium]|nr:hypothetical protein [Gemmatimonadaceae bacterium]